MPVLTRSLLRFMGWWGRELVALAPSRLRQWWRGLDDILLLSFDGNRGIFERPVAGGRQEILVIETGTGSTAPEFQASRQLARAANKNFRLLLEVPPTQVVRRTLTLPLAVEENLRQTLTFELDRYTPFKPDQVYFDFRLQARDPVQQRIKVELAVVQRSVVDRETTRVAELGLSAAGAVLTDEVLGGNGYFNFLPAAASSGKRTSRTWWRMGLSLLAAILMATFLAVPIWQKRATANSLLESIAEARVAAEETSVLRDRLDKVVREYNFPLDMKWGSPSALLVMEELSKRLPDDSFIIQLDFDGQTVQLQGESASASGLLELLESSPMFKDVAFKAQLIKIQGTPNDRFHLSAVLEVDSPAKHVPTTDGSATTSVDTSSATSPVETQPVPVSRP